MAVERKTFLWIGNDRAYRGQQAVFSELGAAITGGYAYGATGIKGYNRLFSPQSITPGDPANGAEGSTGHKKALDEFWNAKQNWAERIEGFSGDAGTSGGASPEEYFYTRATRIPHRGDNVIFSYVKGSTGNGLVRGSVGCTDDPGIPIKAFDAPLSPCLFGGISRPTDGLSGEGSIWVNSGGEFASAGSSQANRSGGLASVKVLPSYFHREFGVISNEKFTGFAQDLDYTAPDNGGSSNVARRSITQFWGGSVASSSFTTIAGASFGNVTWAIGNTGINLKALDVQLNTPFRMSRLSTNAGDATTPDGDLLFPETIQNTDQHGGQTINIRGGNLSPLCSCRLGHADDIVNLITGCRDLTVMGGSVQNWNLSDWYLAFTDDRDRKARAQGATGAVQAPEHSINVMIHSFISYRGTVTNQLRCDPCWYTSVLDTTNSIGNPDIRFGPYFVCGSFRPKVTTAGTVSCFPQYATNIGYNIDNVLAGENVDPITDTVQIGGYWNNFTLRGDGNERFAVTTINMKEFNPRWEVTTSEGNPSSLPVGVRGFNNQIGMAAGCTVTNLNIDAGVFRVDVGHPGGDTFDEPNEVGDVVVLNGFAEEKAFLRGEHPAIPAFNAFYIGKGGVSETGQVFQVKNAKADFDFGPGVYLRSGPAATGITGAANAFIVPPRARKR